MEIGIETGTEIGWMVDHLDRIDASISLQVVFELASVDLLLLSGTHLSTLSFIHKQLLTVQSLNINQCHLMSNSNSNSKSRCKTDGFIESDPETGVSIARNCSRLT